MSDGSGISTLEGLHCNLGFVFMALYNGLLGSWELLGPFSCSDSGTGTCYLTRVALWNGRGRIHGAFTLVSFILPMLVPQAWNCQVQLLAKDGPSLPLTTLSAVLGCWDNCFLEGSSSLAILISWVGSLAAKGLALYRAGDLSLIVTTSLMIKEISFSMCFGSNIKLLNTFFFQYCTFSFLFASPALFL